MNPSSRALPLAVLLLLAAGGAEACVPSWTESRVDPCLVFCPAGDIEFHVIVRDLAHNPILQSTVVLEFCSASGWSIDPVPPPDPLPPPRWPCAPSALTGMDGEARLALHAGGTTSTGEVKVYGDGVWFGSRTLASPDQNGDLVVNADDEAILAAKLGTADRSADFDGDGIVTAADQALQHAHLGHAAQRPVPVAISTWGRIKSLGR